MRWNPFASTEFPAGSRTLWPTGINSIGFQSQFEASFVSSHIDDWWYNETVCNWMTIYIYNNHKVPWADISLILSLSIHPYRPSHPRACKEFFFIGSSRLSNTWQSIWRSPLKNVAHQLALFQLYPGCLVHLIWMVLKIRGRWVHSCCFVGFSFQDLFTMARSRLVQLLSIFFLPVLSQWPCGASIFRTHIHTHTHIYIYIDK